MPFDIGWEEMILILVVVVFIFGPDKLPEFARTLGRFVREIRRMSAEFTEPLNELMAEPPPEPEPVAPPGPPENICPACGSRNISDKTECGLCGTKLDPPALRARAESAAARDGDGPGANSEV
jgi:TatA/E family protein of Tat protein translocase